ncbi:uncharacterized protein PgNI_12495 [Pyricularia grisea]|uniref:Uncharacterized protein n=1 Tax=Pyricularia grisea TaxID=148305 RepID=A0A6P8AMM0_PYRGI|nr:uncharacterized protein PgNI_12495 [Pyricularia grisea]TLD03272.1 hypothetical protein PgNI_12495 [Pyricularia grisea]
MSAFEGPCDLCAASECSRKLVQSSLSRSGYGPNFITWSKMSPFPPDIFCEFLQ